MGLLELLGMREKAPAKVQIAGAEYEMKKLVFNPHKESGQRLAGLRLESPVAALVVHVKPAKNDEALEKRMEKAHRAFPKLEAALTARGIVVTPDPEQNFDIGAHELIAPERDRTTGLISLRPPTYYLRAKGLDADKTVALARQVLAEHAAGKTGVSEKPPVKGEVVGAWGGEPLAGPPPASPARVAASARKPNDSAARTINDEVTYVMGLAPDEQAKAFNRAVRRRAKDFGIRLDLAAVEQGIAAIFPEGVPLDDDQKRLAMQTLLVEFTPPPKKKPGGEKSR